VALQLVDFMLPPKALWSDCLCDALGFTPRVVA